MAPGKRESPPARSPHESPARSERRLLPHRWKAAELHDLRFGTWLQESPVAELQGLEVRRNNGLQWRADKREMPRIFRSAKLAAEQ